MAACMSRVIYKNVCRQLIFPASARQINTQKLTRITTKIHVTAWSNNSTLLCNSRALSTSSVRWDKSSSQVHYVLDPPPIPPPVDPTVTAAASGVEPTFESVGLGGWSPVGIVQSCLEYMHIDWGLPWWTSIMIGTVVIRVLIFPLVVMAQRNAARMGNNLPQMQVLQMKLTEARQMGNPLEAARYSQELLNFMKEKNISPLRNIMVPLAQAPIFISMFVALRGMANLPVDSFHTGGLFWFTDLTIPDPFYLMPLITSATLWLTIEVGADAAKLQQANMGAMKYVLRALPIIIFPFTLNFPGAVLCYWVSTNFISLIQVGVLRVPAVRDFFGIEKAISFKPEDLPMKSKGFVEGIKDSWTNMKITQELENRRSHDEMQFRKAGTGPLRKTYRFDPTHPPPKSSPTAASAKRRTP